MRLPTADDSRIRSAIVSFKKKLKAVKPVKFSRKHFQWMEFNYVISCVSGGPCLDWGKQTTDAEYLHSSA